MFENQLYSGIISLLKELKASVKALVTATSKPEIFAKQILEHFGIAHYFTIIAGERLDSSLISKSDVITSALAQVDYNPQTTIIVGDREHDI